jgi:hypothetical protein
MMFCRKLNPKATEQSAAPPIDGARLQIGPLGDELGASLCELRLVIVARVDIFFYQTFGSCIKSYYSTISADRHL